MTTRVCRPPARDAEMRIIQWAMWRAVRPRPDTVWVHIAHADGPGYRSALLYELYDEGIRAVARSGHMLRVHRAGSVARFLQTYVDRSGPGALVRTAAARYGRAWTRRVKRVASAPDVVAECVAAAAGLMEVIPIP